MAHLENLDSRLIRSRMGIAESAISITGAFLLAAALLFPATGARAASITPAGAAPVARVHAVADQDGKAPSTAGHPGRPHIHEHLPQWIREHESLPLAEQERALRAEPGFDHLSEQRQQRLFQRLQQLDAMPPAQRERTLRWMEAMQRLSPDQRRQVRHTMRDIRNLPPDQRQKMHEAYHRLRQIPPDQRQAALNSQKFKSELSERERQMLETLMRVHPDTSPAR